MSAPLAQTVSLSRSLKVSLSLALADHCQVFPSTQVSGMPRSQLSPAPCPRRNRLLPKPTSIFASIVVFAVDVAVLCVTVLCVSFTSPFCGVVVFLVVFVGFIFCILLQLPFNQSDKLA